MKSIAATFCFFASKASMKAPGSIPSWSSFLASLGRLKPAQISAAVAADIFAKGAWFKSRPLKLIDHYKRPLDDDSPRREGDGTPPARYLDFDLRQTLNRDRPRAAVHHDGSGCHFDFLVDDGNQAALNGDILQFAGDNLHSVSRLRSGGRQHRRSRSNANPLATANVHLSVYSQTRGEERNVGRQGRSRRQRRAGHQFDAVRP